LGLNAGFLLAGFAVFAVFAVFAGLAAFAAFGDFADVADVAALAAFAARGLGAGFGFACRATLGALADVAVFDAAARFFLLAFFRGAALPRLLVLRRLAMECLAAVRTVNGAGFAQRVVEVAATRTARLERLVAAHDTVRVVGLVGTKAPAHGAALCDVVGHAGK